MTTAPIPLTTEIIEAIRTWARDDRLWSSQETTEFNLCTFARLILSGPRAPDPDPSSASLQETIDRLTRRVTELEAEREELKRHTKADDVAFDSMNHAAVDAETRAEQAESRLASLRAQVETLKAAIIDERVQRAKEAMDALPKENVEYRLGVFNGASQMESRIMPMLTTLEGQ